MMIREWMGPDFYYCGFHNIFVRKTQWEKHSDTYGVTRRVCFRT
jgi:hypothetical protein